MPFELGLASALTLIGTTQHQVIVLEAQSYRLDRTLSDYKGRDPLVHRNRSSDLVGGLLGVFEAPSGPTGTDLRSAVRVLSRSGSAIKRDLHLETIFTPAAFRSLVGAAVDLAVDRGYIEP